jgi:hypothetical protein
VEEGFAKIVGRVRVDPDGQTLTEAAAILEWKPGGELKRALLTGCHGKSDEF